jgi:hypothetical protein
MQAKFLLQRRALAEAYFAIFKKGLNMLFWPIFGVQ